MILQIFVIGKGPQLWFLNCCKMCCLLNAVIEMVELRIRWCWGAYKLLRSSCLFRITYFDWYLGSCVPLHDVSQRRWLRVNIVFMHVQTDTNYKSSTKHGSMLRSNWHVYGLFFVYVNCVAMNLPNENRRWLFTQHSYIMYYTTHYRHFWHYANKTTEISLIWICLRISSYVFLGFRINSTESQIFTLSCDFI